MRQKIRFHTMIKGVLLGILVNILAACAPPAKKISDADIQAAMERGEDLHALYFKAQRELKKQPNNKVLRENLRRISGALQVREKFRELQGLIGRLHTREGVLPSITVPSDDGEYSIRTDVDSLLKGKLAELTPDPDIHRQARELIDNEIARRNESLLEKISQLNELPAENLSERLALAKEIFILNGDAELQKKNNETVLQAASQRAFAWLEQKQYRQASALFRSVLDENPELHDAKEGLSLADFSTELFEMEQYREQADVENVYHTFLRIANNPASEKFIDQLRPPAVDLANYFNLSAQNNILNGDLLEAYRELRKIAAITKMVSLPGRDRTIEQDFVSQIFVLANEARDNGDLGLVMAYLATIEEIDASSVEIQRALNDVRRELYDGSVVKIAAFPFESPSNTPGLGALITAALTQFFVKGQYQDIRMLDRQSLDEVMREQQIRALETDHEINLSASDYLIQGAVLEANVDTTEQKIQNTRRVVVEVRRIPNPEFEEWRKLSKQQRAKKTAPPPFLSEEVKENVSFTQTLHSKLGSINVNYRIIDPVNGELLHIDTLQLGESFEDESRDGIEVGRFVQKAKTANLPPDSQILRNLANALAEKIALNVAEKLENPERRYLDAANRMMTGGKLVSAVRELGKAIVILEAKGQPVEKEMATLKQLALQIQ